MSQTCDENGIFIVKRAGMEGIMELIEIRKKLKKELDKGRYEHTKGVMYTAGCLAMAHEYSMEKAMLAGLLHDCAKCIPNDQKIEMCEQNHILINPVEYKSPYLLHAKLGAFMAEILHDTLAYLSSRGGSIDATTKMTYDFYRQYRKNHN